MPKFARWTETPSIASYRSNAWNDALIPPILRGRDIKRYGYVKSGLYLINTHNGIKGRLDRIHIEDYPAVKAHLDQYWDKIEKRADQGDTPYNLRNCAYLEDFSKPKIAWASVGETYYSLIPAGFYLLDTNYFFSIEDYHFLLAFLNSKSTIWWINQEDTQIGIGGAYRHYKYNLERLKVPNANGLSYSLIDEILDNRNVENNQRIINQFINDCYNFSMEEIEFIESL